MIKGRYTNGFHFVRRAAIPLLARRFVALVSRDTLPRFAGARGIFHRLLFLSRREETVTWHAIPVCRVRDVQVPWLRVSGCLRLFAWVGDVFCLDQCFVSSS